MENNNIMNNNLDISLNENSKKKKTYKNLKVEVSLLTENNNSPKYQNQLNAFFEQFSSK
jgi:hypothetical protein